MAEDRSPLEAALDVVLYAPVGLVITATEQLPELAEKGRSKLTAQVTAARMVGRFAVNQGRRELARRRRETPAGFAERQGTSAPEASEASSGEPYLSGSAPAPAVPSEPTVLTSRRQSEDAREPAVAGEDTHLAIPGYDSLSASQVVTRLAGLTSEELAEVADYEATHRGRRTVMNRVRQLQN